MANLSSRSRYASFTPSSKCFQYACAVSGMICPLTLLVHFAAAGFLPPISPSWDAERTAKHYRDHEKGIHGASVLLIVSGMLYLPLTAVLSAQIRRIPNVHYAVGALQLAAGAASSFTFTLAGMILAVAGYRVNRPAYITQALNDLYWITVLMPWPPFMVQNYAFAYAILVDSRPEPLFRKEIAILNIVVPLLYIPTMALHCVTTGPLAWNGAYTFWVVGFCTALQLNFDAFCVLQTIRTKAGLRDCDG